MKKYFYHLFVVLFCWGLFPRNAFSQQLPQFSQYIFNGLNINPAYAGYKNQGYIQSTYRNQWTNLPGAPQTFSLTGDFSLNDGLAGFGVTFLNDQIGPSRTTSGLISYAHRVQTGENSYLSLGIGAGASQYFMDQSMLNPKDPLDPDLFNDSQVMLTPNMNTGLFFYSDRFYAGVSAFNLVGRRSLQREDMALSFHDIHYFITAGAMLPINERIEFKPSILIKEVKGAPTSFDVNGMFLFVDRIWLGASYRGNTRFITDSSSLLNNRTAMAFLLEIFVTSELRLGYAYDKNLNALENFRNNSHEFSIGYYVTKRGAKIKNPRWF